MVYLSILYCLRIDVAGLEGKAYGAHTEQGDERRGERKLRRCTLICVKVKPRGLILITIWTFRWVISLAECTGYVCVCVQGYE